LFSRLVSHGVDVRRCLADGVGGQVGRFPLYRVVRVDARGREKEHLFYSEDEYDQFVRELHEKLEERGQDLQIIEDELAEDVSDRGARNSIRPIRFDEAERVEGLVERLRSFGLPAGCLFEQGNGADAHFTVVSNGHERPASSLLALIPAVRELGREGLDIQRYKGLGEMDAAELAETTLAPGTRRTVQVTIGDAVTADRYFSILAGKDVKPRREFIERHALEVTNLDV
jgi:DNA gyrase subunit B